MAQDFENIFVLIEVKVADNGVSSDELQAVIKQTMTKKTKRNNLRQIIFIMDNINRLSSLITQPVILVKA